MTYGRPRPIIYIAMIHTKPVGPGTPETPTRSIPFDAGRQSQDDYCQGCVQLCNVVLQDGEACLDRIEAGEPEPDIEAERDHSDDICPCGDPDCSRPFGHPEEN